VNVVPGILSRSPSAVKDFPYVEISTEHTFDVAASLRKQLGQFLRKRRGRRTLTAFARNLGISPSSLHRMEMGEQNVTLKTLEHLLKRLKLTTSDIFRDPRI
jgi:DNA-binding Xre family transcriptional regulator